MASKTDQSAIANAWSTRNIDVWACVTPQSIDEVREAINRSAGRVSMSGARLSPDTQFGLAGALHLDMSRMDRVVRFEPLEHSVTVQAGMRWSALLRFLLPHSLVPRVMPDFANFSIGGSISSNQRGPYVGAGPVAAGVRSLSVVLADGSTRTVRPQQDPQIFRALVGGFGGVGVIVEVELELTANTPLLRKHHSVDVEQYPDFFRSRVRTDPGAIMHRAELRAPDFARLRCETWVECKVTPTWPQKLHGDGAEDPLGSMLSASYADGFLARAARLLIDPMRSRRRTVHWRSLEASHDLRALDRSSKTAVHVEFQAYAIPMAGFQAFVQALKSIVAEYRVPLVSVSVISPGADSSSHLALVDGDALVFRLVLRPASEQDLLGPKASERDDAVWTRELIDAAFECGGRFDPSFRMYSTREQFERSFPGSAELVALRRELDPGQRFGNGFWSRYLETADAGSAASGVGVANAAERASVKEASAASIGANPSASEFCAAMASEPIRDSLYRLLVSIVPDGNGARLFRLLQEQCARSEEDELIYLALARASSKWRRQRAGSAGSGGWLEQLQPGLLAFCRDRLAQLQPQAGRKLDGVLELGTGARSISALRQDFRLAGEAHQIEGFGLFGAGIQARESGAKRLRSLAVSALPARAMPESEDPWSGLPSAPESLDLVVLNAGLSRVPSARLAPLLEQVASLLRPTGMLLVLDHDADSAHSSLEAAVAGRLGALCEGASWPQAAAMHVDLRPADEWASVLAMHGLVEHGPRERLPRSPLGDTQMAFRRRLEE